MTERDALYRAVCAEPEEDTPRLVFADWLDEHAAGGAEGRADREWAAYIRYAVRFARLSPGLFHCARTRESVLSGLHDRLFAPQYRCRCAMCRTGREFNALEYRNRFRWESEPVDDVTRRLIDGWEPAVAERMRNPPVPIAPGELQALNVWRLAVFAEWPRVELRRGFAEVLRVGADAFLRFAGELFARAPITEVVLTDLVFPAEGGSCSRTGLPPALEPWVKQTVFADPFEGREVCSAGLVRFGRAERDKFWAQTQ